MDKVSFFKMISEYFWLLCIVVATINLVLVDLFRDAEADKGIDVELRRKYRLWFWGLSIVPWLVVGYAQLTGAVPYVWAYFRPKDDNPFVWTFYGTILLVYIVGAYWVFFRNGAQIAADLRLFTYRVFSQERTMSPFWIKVFAIAAFPFFAFWLWMAWTMDVDMHF